MHGQSRERKKILEREIAIADGVEAVRRDSRKSQITRERLAIERKRTARQRARTHRANIRAFCAAAKTVPRHDESFAMRQQPVRKQKGCACCM